MGWSDAKRTGTKSTKRLVSWFVRCFPVARLNISLTGFLFDAFDLLFGLPHGQRQHFFRRLLPIPVREIRVGQSAFLEYAQRLLRLFHHAQYAVQHLNSTSESRDYYAVLQYNRRKRRKPKNTRHSRQSVGREIDIVGQFVPPRSRAHSGNPKITVSRYPRRNGSRKRTTTAFWTIAKTRKHALSTRTFENYQKKSRPPPFLFQNCRKVIF